MAAKSGFVKYASHVFLNALLVQRVDIRDCRVYRATRASEDTLVRSDKDHPMRQGIIKVTGRRVGLDKENPSSGPPDAA